MKRKISILLICIVGITALLACQLTGLTFAQPTAIVSQNQAPPSAADLVSVQDSLVALYDQVSPGVVTVRVFNSDGTLSVGTGWIYDIEGYIVTNQHVVDTATRAEIDFPSGFKTYGDVIGSDEHTDLAVIKVSTTDIDLQPLTMGDSDTLRVGQVVVAIGDPETLTGTMTMGIVSALGRSLPSGVQAASGGYFSAGDIIQTDALLNHGNSGGPLLNLEGKIIGINFRIQLDTSSGAPINSGIGFAISINVVKRVIPELIQTGKFDFPYLGITARDDLTLEAIEALGLKSTSGAYVDSITSGGPADHAGVIGATTPVDISGYEGLNAGGDLIVAVDGQPVRVFDDLMRYLVLHKSPGDKITLTVLRGSKQVDIVITLGIRP